jgi:hypothetical protein
MSLIVGRLSIAASIKTFAFFASLRENIEIRQVRNLPYPYPAPVGRHSIAASKKPFAFFASLREII